MKRSLKRFRGIIMQAFFRINTLLLLLLLFEACASASLSRDWLSQTKKSNGQNSGELNQIVKGFSRIKLQDRKLAVEAIASNQSAQGQQSLLSLLDQSSVRTDPLLRSQIITELIKRKEEDTAKELLSKGLQYPDHLLVKPLLPYVGTKLGNLGADQIAKMINNNSDKMNADLANYFIDLKYAPAHPMILKTISKKPEIVTANVATYFQNIKESAVPEAFAEAVHKKPDLLRMEQVTGIFLKHKYEQVAPYLYKEASSQSAYMNAPLIRYFGQVRYEPAAKMIKNNLEQRRFIEPGLEALAAFNKKEHNLYILALTRDSNPNVRLAALQTVVGIEDPTLISKADLEFSNILKNYAKEPHAVVLTALDYFEKHSYAVGNYEKIQAVYRGSDDDTIKSRALAALSGMRGESMARTRSRMDRNLRGADADLALTRRRKVKVQPIKSPVLRKRAPLRKRRYCTIPTRYPKNYFQRVNSAFTIVFGPDLTRALRNRISNVIKSYAGETQLSASGKFIRRAYRKHFRLEDDAQIKRQMQIGLSHPGSLSVVVWNIHQEYKTDKMRIYAISRLFSIERWKSQEILRLVREKCL